MNIDDQFKKMKSQQKKRYEAILFDYKTTALTDFRNNHICEPPFKSEYKETVKVRKTWPYPLRETQTMTDWKEGRPVPFDLFIKPKEIIQTDPRHVPQYVYPKYDDEREEVRKTRPRVVMSPAVVMDDADTDQLKAALKEMYSSVTHKDMREGIARIEPTKYVVSARACPRSDCAYKTGEVQPSRGASGVAHGLRILGRKAAAVLLQAKQRILDKAQRVSIHRERVFISNENETRSYLEHLLKCSRLIT